MTSLIVLLVYLCALLAVGLALIPVVAAVSSKKLIRRLLQEEQRMLLEKERLERENAELRKEIESLLTEAPITLPSTDHENGGAA